MLFACLLMVGCQRNEYQSVETDEWETTLNPWLQPDSALVARAKAGDARAQAELGDVYLLGTGGVEPDEDKSVYWNQKSVEQDSPFGQFNMYYNFENGFGTDVNDVKAEWLKNKALSQLLPLAEAGDSLAQFYLAQYYHMNPDGKTDENMAAAIAWYKKSAECGCGGAQLLLGTFYMKGNMVEENDSLALYWFRKAAEQNSGAALYCMGVCYSDGYGVEQQYDKAFEYLKKAAELGNAGARSLLGSYYHEGLVMEQNDEEALRWWQLAALQGDADAQNWIGVCYEKGMGLEMSVQKALKWYRLAAIGGSVEAQNNLGVFYLNGNVVKMWPELAVTLFYISAKGGCASALYNLGMCYYRGYGVERNKDKGREFLEQAAEMGEPSATKILDMANEISNYLMEE